MKPFFRTIVASLLAAFARAIIRKYRPKVVMVTGSVGKTSTKDAIAAVLHHGFYIRASEKSYNSEFGVPLTIIGAKNPWTNAAAWSRVLGQAMSTEAFAQQMGRSLETWLTAQAPLKKAGEQALEQTLQSLNLASRTQLTSVARQIVELEERVERVEDGIAAILRRLDDLAHLVASRERPADRITAERG